MCADVCAHHWLGHNLKVIVSYRGKLSNTPYLVIASVRDKNVTEMTKLAVQLMQVAVAMPVLRAHSG